jgi:hypothetical protein
MARRITHVARRPVRDRFGYLHARCACGWHGPSSAYPADVAADYAAHGIRPPATLTRGEARP